MSVKLAKARTDLEASTGVAGPFIDIIIQFLPQLLAICGLTPKAAHKMAQDHPVIATMRTTSALILQGFTLKEARQAAKGYVALAASTPVEDAEEIVAAIEAS